MDVNDPSDRQCDESHYYEAQIATLQKQLEAKEEASTGVVILPESIPGHILRDGEIARQYARTSSNVEAFGIGVEAMRQALLNQPIGET